MISSGKDEEVTPEVTTIPYDLVTSDFGNTTFEFNQSTPNVYLGM